MVSHIKYVKVNHKSEHTHTHTHELVTTTQATTNAINDNTIELYVYNLMWFII